MKIIQILKFHAVIIKNGNLKITLENNQKHENPRMSREDYEIVKIQELHIRIIQIKQILEFHVRITKIMKLLKLIKRIMKN